MRTYSYAPLQSQPGGPAHSSSSGTFLEEVKKEVASNAWSLVQVFLVSFAIGLLVGPVR